MCVCATYSILIDLTSCMYTVTRYMVCGMYTPTLRPEAEVEMVPPGAPACVVLPGV